MMPRGSAAGADRWESAVKCYQACLTVAARSALLLALTACGYHNHGYYPPPYTPPPSTGDGSTPTGLIQGSDGNFYGTTANGGRYGAGTFFKVTLAGVETVLYSFVGGTGDGANPEGVIQGSDGNFYGSTSGGGTGGCQFGCGAAFKITPDGAESVLYFFTGAADGGDPNGLIQGSDGNFYGTAAYGGVTSGQCGPGGCGVAFRLTPAGVESVLHSFAGGSADGAVAASLIQGTDGNFYGVTAYGGQSNDGTVFKVTAAGAETVLHSFAGGSDGAIPQTPLTQGTDGSFYGTTPVGGTSSNGVVFRITPAGVETVLHAFAGGTADGAQPYTGVVQGSDGNFYGTTSAGGDATCPGGCGIVFKMTPAGAESALYLFTAGANSQPPQPSSLLQGSDGNFYGTTSDGGQFGLGTLFKLTPAGVETVLYSFGTNP
jgi:uncharacterized repeat protein (TIGR03803 family)